MNTEKVIEMCHAGATLQEIGESQGVSRQRVHQWLRLRPELNGIREAVIAAGRQSKATSKVARFGGLKAREFYADNLRSEQAAKLATKKSNNSRRGGPFNLTWADLEWPTHCPILGLELDYYSSAGRRVENSVSFDRIDPSKGYVKGNVVVMSWRANRIKNDGSASEHRRIADWLDSRVT